VSAVNDPVVGLRVQVIIDEDGTQKPPFLPPGTVIRRMIGSDRNLYYVVRLDAPVPCERAVTGDSWTLNDLVLAPSFKGDSLARLVHRQLRDPLLVGIANVIRPLAQREEILDFSHIEYFARGRIERA